MKKIAIVFLLCISGAVFAQIPDVPAVKDINVEKESGMSVTMAKKIATSCKSEQLKYCKGKKMDALKTCLIENKNNLSKKCKSSIGAP